MPEIAPEIANDGSDLLRRFFPDVSRETYHRLTLFADLLRQWQRRHNIVADSTLQNLWVRHILDSAQILPLLQFSTDDESAVIDLGSGAGFPGLILAIFLQVTADETKTRPGPQIHLVEAQARKCAFLRHAVAQTGCRITLHEKRIEMLRPSDFPENTLICARALAPLVDLCRHVAPFSQRGARAIFHKGKKFREEITQACDKWAFHLIERESWTDRNARILELSHIRPAQARPETADSL